MNSLADIRVAIVHYWFVGRAGGERVVEALAELFPQADLFSLVADRGTLAPCLQSRKLNTSFLQKMPGATRFHRHYLLLQPFALEQFDLSKYDLVISSESGPAKGVITSAKTCHICYCHSPMRYIWDMYAGYRGNMGYFVGPVFSLAAHYMRMWDYVSAARVNHFVANSRFVASRIRKVYGRESTVIYPPVNIPDVPLTGRRGDHFLAVGRLVDYKRFDLAVEACTRLRRPLRIVGDGPEYRALKRIAGPSIEFLGALGDKELQEQFSHCRALLFPGEEDFGIVPVEVQSFGRPVIAYASGGALETVRGIFPHESLSLDATGIFFTEQSASSLGAAILRFESCEGIFSAEEIRNHSLQFDSSRFRCRMADFVTDAMRDFRSSSPRPKIASSYHFTAPH